MPDLIFSSIIRDLKAALHTSKHPFRYCTLATSDIHGAPRMRTVVLRDLDDDLNMTIYTDKRSKKTTHIKDQNTVGMLFLDSERLVQISIQAKAKMITNSQTLKSIWDRIPQKSRKDYTTQLAPGKEIKNAAAVDYLEGAHFFSAIKIIPYRIEYLRLKRPNHIRVLFEKEDNGWNNSFLVP